MYIFVYVCTYVCQYFGDSAKVQVKTWSSAGILPVVCLMHNMYSMYILVQFGTWVWLCVVRTHLQILHWMMSQMLLVIGGSSRDHLLHEWHLVLRCVVCVCMCVCVRAHVYVHVCPYTLLPCRRRISWLPTSAVLVSTRCSVPLPLSTLSPSRTGKRRSLLSTSEDQCRNSEWCVCGGGEWDGGSVCVSVQPDSFISLSAFVLVASCLYVRTCVC